MRQKPWPVIILAMFYFLSPVATVFFSAYSEKVSALAYMQSMFQTGTLTDWILVFGVTPLAGFCIWICRKWSYFLYLLLLTFLVLHNFSEWQQHRDTLTFAGILAMNLFNLVIVSYFLVPQVRTTYWDRRVRWWESKPRFNITEACRISNSTGKHAGQITNISEGGAFIICKDPLNIGDNVRLRTKVLGQPIIATGQIVHQFRGSSGFGICFAHNDATARRLQSVTKGLAAQAAGNQSRLHGLIQWGKTLFRTGKGLFPDIPKR